MLELNATELHSKALQGDPAALKVLVETSLRTADMAQAERWLDVAVQFKLQQFYATQIQFWLADQWGPWPWDRIAFLLEQDVALHPEAYWLLTKAHMMLGLDYRATLALGARAGSIRCAECDAILQHLDGYADEALASFKRAAANGSGFSHYAVEWLGQNQAQGASSTQTLNPTIDLKVYENFVPALACQWLIYLHAGQCKPAHIVDPVTGQARPDPYRTGDVLTLIDPLVDPVSLWIRVAVHKRLDCALENIEPCSIIRYKTSDQYRPHFDGFPNDSAALKNNSGGQRVRTAILYLNDDFEGGNTAFPRLDVSVSPRAGTLVSFQNADDSMALLKKSLHQGCPITRGEKLIASFWVRESEFKRSSQ